MIFDVVAAPFCVAEPKRFGELLEAVIPKVILGVEAVSAGLSLVVELTPVPKIGLEAAGAGISFGASAVKVEEVAGAVVAAGPAPNPKETGLVEVKLDRLETSCF